MATFGQTHDIFKYIGESNVRNYKRFRLGKTACFIYFGQRNVTIVMNFGQHRIFAYFAQKQTRNNITKFGQEKHFSLFLCEGNVQTHNELQTGKYTIFKKIGQRNEP